MDLPVHLSTQASVANKEAVDFFSGLGVKRIVLARECSLAQIAAIKDHIKKKKISCEIETFIHGAMCLSISGRCFLSEYSFGKSANQGECLQPCRRHYTIIDKEDEISYRIGNDYILSPKDLCTIDILDHLVRAGIDAFKIEGRMKSPEYVKVVTAAYRKGIDAVLDKRYSTGLKRSLGEELAKVYNRGFSTGFLFGQPRDAVSTNLKHNYEKIFVGKVTKFFKRISVAQISILDSPLKVNDTIMLIGKKTAARTAKVGEMEYRHRPRKKAVRGETVGVKIPFAAKLNDKVFIWRKKKVLT
jgi:putative protease